jgi:hypothetical protein
MERRRGNNVPTKKGIRLPLGRWKILTNDTMFIDEALEKGQAHSLHLGGNVYCKVSEHGVCVDIRQYWTPPDHEGDVVPTKKGICLRPAEYFKLKEVVKKIGDAVPELNGVVPCYAQSDHINQMGYLRCAECNPNGSHEFEEVAGEERDIFDRPQCQICSCTFARSDNLRRHMITVHRCMP